MAKIYKYRCSMTESTTDGSGFINWDMWAIEPNGDIIPGYHATFQTPFNETQDALNAGNVGLVRIAIKVLLETYMPAGWDAETMNEVTDDNLGSGIVQDEVDIFVNTEGGYPYDVLLDPIP